MKYPLDGLEKSLKNIYRQYPQYYDHILSGDELFEYIKWLIKTYSDSSESLQFQEPKSRNYFDEIGKKFLNKTFDENDLEQLGKIYTMQTEDKYLNQNYDISVYKMIRYMPAHWHTNSYFQVYYAMDKECTIYFDNEKLTLSPGFILIVAPYVSHASPCYDDDKYLSYYLIRSSTFEKVFWQQLESDSVMAHFFRKALNYKENNTSYILFDTENDKEIFSDFIRIKEEYDAQDLYSSQLINNLMSQIFILTLRRYEKNARLPHMENIHWKNEFSNIFTFIQNNYANITLEEVAAHTGYSTRQVNRIINSCLNLGFNDLITFMKMEKAAALLKENDLSIQEISNILGYSDISSFYRAFRKYYRVSPARFAKQNTRI